MDAITLPPLSATDLVIRDLALFEHNLTDEARELAADAHIYRELAHVTTAEVARLTTLTRLQTATINALRAELARYTADQIGRAA